MEGSPASIHRSVVALAMALLVPACGASPAATTPASNVTPPDATVVAAASASTTARTSAPPGGGLEDPANDADLVSHARKLLACPWKYTGGWPTECDAPLAAWRKLDLKGKAPTLVRFVADENPRVRYIGATGLDGIADWKTDKAIGTALLDALTKYEADVSALAIAHAAGRIDAAKTGLEAQMKRIAVELPNAQARGTFVESVQFENREIFYETVMTLARTEKDRWVRHAAVRAFWTGTPSDKRGEVCALWLEKTSDEDERVATTAAFYAGGTPFGCPKEYDALVTLLEQKTKGQLETSDWMNPVRFMAESDKVPEKNKKALVAIGKRVAETTGNFAGARIQGMRAVMAADKKAGKALAKKLQKDADQEVKAEADETVAAKAD